MANILVIDDDALVRESFARCFRSEGHEVALAADLSEGLELASVTHDGPDVVYLDLNLPDGDGRRAIDELAAAPSGPEIIVVTGLGDNYGARETMASGAWDYLRKPASPELLRSSLVEALRYRAGRVPASAAPRASTVPRMAAGSGADDPGAMLGQSPAMLRARRTLERSAASEASVLITGETGTGKELAAKALHAASLRAAGPFVVVDCAALSRNLVESVLYGHARGAFTGAHADQTGLVARANGGVLFLDEVGELPLSQQKSFLRVLQERRFRPVGGAREQTSDFRLAAATNRDLEAMAAKGLFRSDLLFRLRTVEIALPPLRERGEDVGLLARRFAARACARYDLAEKTLSAHLLRALTAYPWPGNVRELAGAMEAAVIEAGQDPVLYPKHLPAHMRLSALGEGRARRKRPTAACEQELPPRPPQGPPPSYADHKTASDRDYFARLMAAADRDVAKAAVLSGLSVPSVYRRLKELGLSRGARA